MGLVSDGIIIILAHFHLFVLFNIGKNVAYINVEMKKYPIPFPIPMDIYSYLTKRALCF